jgi:type II secretory pathway pseudopilin PulG
MKTAIWIIIVVIILAILGIGILGYIKAQDLKKQGKEVEQITADTMKLMRTNSNDPEISLTDWKNLSDKAPTIKSDFEKITTVPNSLKNNLDQFYSAKAQEKYKEAQYLQFLLEGQSSLDLKNNTPKSKGQIETVLSEFDKLQNNLSQSDLSLGPDFSTMQKKVEQEATAYKSSLTDLASKMDFNSPSVQLNTAGFDKAVDELKMAIVDSLNQWVDLQDSIKQEISDLANKNWVNPFMKFDKEN